MADYDASGSRGIVVRHEPVGFSIAGEHISPSAASPESQYLECISPIEFLLFERLRIESTLPSHVHFLFPEIITQPGICRPPAAPRLIERNPKSPFIPSPASHPGLLWICRLL